MAAVGMQLQDEKMNETMELVLLFFYFFFSVAYLGKSPECKRVYVGTHQTKK